MGNYPTQFEDSDLSGLPTADPGNGHPWLDASGAIIVGANALNLSANWGGIGGTLSDQADLAAALSAKADSTAVTSALAGKANTATTLAGYGITDAVATTGAQNVAGVKSFTDGLIVAGILKTFTVGVSGGNRLDISQNDSTSQIQSSGNDVLMAVRSTYLTLRGATVTKGAILYGTDVFGWGSALWNPPDACLARASAGVVEVNSGTAGDYRDLKARAANFSGNVGIGAASPLAKLHVEGSAAAAEVGMFLKNTDTSGYTVVRLGGTHPYSTGAFYALGSTYSTSGPYVQNGFALETLGPGGLSLTAGYVNADMRFYTGGLASTNERMRIFANGNVAIGKTTDDGVNKLQVAGSISASGGVDVGPVTFAVLNATSAAVTAGVRRVTDRSNKLAYPDGTNWRWMGDDSIIS